MILTKFILVEEQNRNNLYYFKIKAPPIFGYDISPTKQISGSADSH